MVSRESYEEWRQPDESLASNMFSWFIACDRAFCVPIRHCVVHGDKKPQTVDLILALDRWREVPFGIYGDPDWWQRLNENLQDTLKSMQRCYGQRQPQRFELCVHDAPLQLADWRRLKFAGVIDKFETTRAIELPHAVHEQLMEMNQGKRPDGISAKIAITISGGITRAGDWRNANPFPAPGKDFAEIGKQAAGLAKSFLEGSIETAANLTKEYQASMADDRAMEARQGRFETDKPLPRIFEEVQRILLQPIGPHHWSILVDTDAAQIVGRLGWVEEPFAKREITGTFRFLSSKTGTTVEYDYLVYENPPGGVFTNQLIRTTNQWIRSCTQ